MLRDKILRNVFILMFVAESICALRYVTDIALGGSTEWWQSVSASIIAAALFMLFVRHKKKVRQNECCKREKYS